MTPYTSNSTSWPKKSAVSAAITSVMILVAGNYTCRLNSVCTNTPFILSFSYITRRYLTLFSSKYKRILSAGRLDWTAGRMDWTAGRMNWIAGRVDWTAGRVNQIAGQVDWTAGRSDWTAGRSDRILLGLQGSNIRNLVVLELDGEILLPKEGGFAQWNLQWGTDSPPKSPELSPLTYKGGNKTHKSSYSTSILSRWIREDSLLFPLLPDSLFVIDIRYFAQSFMVQIPFTSIFDIRYSLFVIRYSRLYHKVSSVSLR